jgi:type IV secretory pathway VirB10-like protein
LFIALLAFQVYLNIAAYYAVLQGMKNYSLFIVGIIMIVFAAMFHIYRYGRALAKAPPPKPIPPAPPRPAAAPKPAPAIPTAPEKPLAAPPTVTTKVSSEQMAQQQQQQQRQQQQQQQKHATLGGGAAAGDGKTGQAADRAQPTPTGSMDSQDKKAL